MKLQQFFTKIKQRRKNKKIMRQIIFTKRMASFSEWLDKAADKMERAQEKIDKTIDEHHGYLCRNRGKVVMSDARN